MKLKVVQWMDVQKYFLDYEMFWPLADKIDGACDEREFGEEIEIELMPLEELLVRGALSKLG